MVLLNESELEKEEIRNKQELNKLKDSISGFEALEFEQKRYIVESLVECIEIYKREIIFHWNF